MKTASQYYERSYWEGKYERPYERRRAQIIQAIYARIPFQSGWLALDLGAGSGFYAHLLQQQGAQVVAADLDHGILATLKGQPCWPVVCTCDHGALPLDNRSLEMVNALDILEHLHQPLRLLDEIQRVLKPGGYALISTQNRNSLEGLKGRLFAKLAGTTWKAWDETHTKIFSYRELMQEVAKRLKVVECGGYYFGIHSVRAHPLPPLIWRSYTTVPGIRGLGFTLFILARKAPS
ncbi:MAG: class I SAM-dependent methyltransferase [Candidatus Omnitrophica bacterium]|nr:class I SAM-dependent methyltransferase [Candidatus Omnitrophota bacterium]